MTAGAGQTGGELPRPPRLARWLLGRALPPGARAASIAGDLLEQFHADVAARSRVVAVGRYWRHVVSVGVRYGLKRRRAGRAVDRTGQPVSIGKRVSMRMGLLRDDLRHAFRSLVGKPGYALVAVLTLAVGVGANTAIFSLLRGVVLNDLPYHDTDRLAVLWTLKLGQNSRDGSSYLNARDWKAQSRSLADIAVYARTEVTRATITGGGDAERITRAMVGPTFFQVLGAPALLGRTLEPADFEAGPRPVVLSHGLWRRRFAADPRIVGKTIEIDGQALDIVGVMAPEFALLTPDAQLWQPLSASSLWARLQNEPTRGIDLLMVVGRLQDGVTFEAAKAELDTIAARLRAAYPRANARVGIEIEPLSDYVIGSRTERSLWLLSGAVGLVLLIACANVANLTLARGLARRHEFSLRAALGADRRRLLGQALTENLVVALLAASVGLLLAWLGARAFRAWAAGAVPRLENVTLDPGVVVFALAIAVAFGLLAGVFPAWQLSFANPGEALREGGSRAVGGRSAQRLRHGLVIAELSLAVILLSGAGLLLRSFLRVQAADRGFDSQNVLLMQVDLPDSYDSPAGSAGYFREALARIRALPGIAAAGAVSDFFVDRRNADSVISVEGQPARRPDEPAPPLLRDIVIPGYFEAMRIPLLKGRLLQERDLSPDAPRVGVINESMARAFWPGADPVGRRLKWNANPDANTPWITVVGVVADMRRQRLDKAAIPSMFQAGISDAMDITVRVSGDRDAARNAIRAQLLALEPEAPPYGITTVEQKLGASVALRTLQTLLLGALAAAALVLGVIGVYGIVHQSVVARTQEIGLRMALGASQRTVLWMVLSGALGLAAAGLTLGLIGSLALGQTLSTFLYETSPLDPLVYATVMGVLLAVTTIACLAPARRAARVDPMVALRYE
jgi:predicted permease